RGGAVAIFALALLPVLAAAGAAVDYARAAKMRSNLQSIVDAAVLTGLKAPASRRAGAAEAHARAALARAGVLIDTLSFTPTTSQGLRGRVKIRL
uniref:pilus assembly protein TadG-related protein n=1 Tax=Staphylococcus aureus TaxID=1280 RepID=UPI00301E44FA